MTRQDLASDFRYHFIARGFYLIIELKNPSNLPDKFNTHPEAVAACPATSRAKGETPLALVHIDNLSPGMILSRNVCDRSGRMLLPAGAELTERSFSIFRMWGVLEADVVGDAPGDEGENAPGEGVDPELLAAAREEVERLFVHNDPEHPGIKELMRLCIERRASRAH